MCNVFQIQLKIIKFVVHVGCFGLCLRSIALQDFLVAMIFHEIIVFVHGGNVVEHLVQRCVPANYVLAFAK